MGYVSNLVGARRISCHGAEADRASGHGHTRRGDAEALECDCHLWSSFLGGAREATA